MTRKNAVAVVGGGLAGLTSALILARNGHDVTLIEKSARLGLTVRGFSRQGVYFDTGLHYTGGLGHDGIVSRYLRYLGLDGLDTVAFRDDGFDEIRFADTGRKVRLPIGYEAMVDGLIRQFPDQAEAVRAYMDAARNDFNSSSLLNFFLNIQGGGASGQTDEKASGQASSQASAETDGAKPVNRTAVPLADYLSGLTDDAHLRAALSIHTLLYGVSPDEVSFTQHAYVSASYFDSVHNFSGGGAALVAAMERRLAELGVTVIKGNAVARLETGGGKKLTHLVLDDGTRIAAEAAICTAHPVALADMGRDVFRPSYLEYLRSLGETTSAYMLFGIADEKPECLRGRNMFLCRDADLANAFRSNADPGQGPFYVASSPQPGGDGGKAGIIVVAPGSFDAVREWRDSTVGKRPEAYGRHKEDVVRRVREAVVSLCPDLEGVRFVDSATPLTMRDYLQTPNGGLYGAKHTVSRFNPMPVTRLPNLWLAGQSVLAPGLMGAMISAFLACGFLVGHDTLHKEAECS